MPLRVGIPYQPYSFLIKKLDDLIIAQDNKGRTRFSSKDAATVIQSALDALTKGGLISIKSGVYEFTSSLDLTGKKAIRLIGETPHWEVADIGVVFKLGNGVNAPIIKCENPSTTDAYITIQNILFNGNKANQASGDVLSFNYTDYVYLKNIILTYGFRFGLYALNSEVWFLENVKAKKNGSHGLYLVVGSLIAVGGQSNDNGGDGYYVGGMTGVKFYGVNSFLNDVDGFHFDGTKEPELFGCNPWKNDEHGFFFDGVERGNIFGGVAKNNNQDPAVGYKYGIALANSVRCTISGVKSFDDQAVKTQSYGLAEWGTSDYNRIIDCDLEGNKLGAVYLTVGGNTVFRRNIGYVTENSGTATGTGAQQAIAHGCDFTPADVNVILTNIDDGANPYLSAPPDATYIYVTAVSGKKYRWEVKRNP